jgi:hypothetical protein
MEIKIALKSLKNLKMDPVFLETRGLLVEEDFFFLNPKNVEQVGTFSSYSACIY